MTDPFSRNIAVSLGLHGALVLIVFFQATLIPRHPLDLRNAIRVDVVDLPRKLEALPEPASEPPAPTPAPPVAEAPPPDPTPKPSVETKTKPQERPDLKNAQSAALNKLKRLSALERMKQQVQEKKTAEAARAAKPDNVVRGNQVSAGNSLSGLERIDFDRYLDELKVKVNSNLSVPQWLAESDLRAQVVVQIDDRGFVIKRTIKKSSNNEVFDAKVLEAIDASSPMPPPPARLRGVLATSGITFNFPN